MTTNKLLDPAPPNGGGGGAEPPPPAPNAFVATLPEEIRGEASLKNIPDVATLAKSYVHAQRMIGSRRLPVPDGTFTEAQWNEWYDGAGRPKTIEAYEVPVIEGVDPTLKPTDDRLKSMRETFHKLGLLPHQAKGLLEYYMRTVDGDMKTAKSLADTANQTALGKLKETWGDKFNANMDLAKATMNKFGTPELKAFLNDSGIGNHPELVKAFSQIGALLVEDKSRGPGNDLQITNETRAVQEIDKLKGDVEFMKALNSREHAGHKVAVERWKSLFAIAFPGIAE